MVNILFVMISNLTQTIYYISVHVSFVHKFFRCISFLSTYYIYIYIYISYCFSLAYIYLRSYIYCFSLAYIYDRSNRFQFSFKLKQDISKWDVSRVTDMSLMFYKAASFAQKLCGRAWIHSTAKRSNMFTGSSGSIESTCITPTHATTTTTTTTTAIATAVVVLVVAALIVLGVVLVLKHRREGILFEESSILLTEQTNYGTV